MTGASVAIKITTIAVSVAIEVAVKAVYEAIRHVWPLNV